MAEQVIAIAGSLTMATAGQAYRDIEKKLAQSDVFIDLSGVEQIDSSAVALLVTILRKAKISRNCVRFGAIPASINQFSEIYGIEDELRSRTQSTC